VPTAYSRSLRIQYNDLSRGSPAFLCLPGWCETKSTFGRITHALGRSQRVIALDWRGHGKSASDGAEFGLEELVDDALAVIRATGIGPFIPVAISHAGWAALELRRRLGERVPRMVCLDWIVGPPPAVFLSLLKALQDREQSLVTRGALFRRWIADCSDPLVVRHIREEMGSYGYEMWGRAARAIERSYASGSPLEALARLDPPCPTLHLYSQPREKEYLTFQQDFAKKHPWFKVQRVEARSHFPALETPDAIARAILDFADFGPRRVGPLAPQS
jgi:pimeloyl-ACP methyl ester carboxylesterase